MSEEEAEKSASWASVSLLAPRADTLRRSAQGGSNVVLLSHARTLRQRGHRVEVYAAASDRSDVRALGAPSSKPLIGSMSYCGRFVRQSGGDVLIAYNEPTVAALAPGRTIVRFGFFSPLPRCSSLPPFRGRFEKAHYLFPSEHLRSRWRDDYPFVPADHTHVIPNGIDLGRFSPARPSDDSEGSPPKVGFAGQWYEGKGLDDLLDAWPQVEARQEKARLRLAGGPGLWTGVEPREHEEWEDRVESAAEERNIEVVGRIDRQEMRAFWNSVDVAVVPSKRGEAFGLVALEAMACGLAVVVTDDGALPWLAGDAGVVVPRGRPGRLAEAITELLADGKRRERLGRRARNRARQFSRERMGDGLCSLVDRVAGARGSTPDHVPGPPGQ